MSQRINLLFLLFCCFSLNYGQEFSVYEEKFAEIKQKNFSDLSEARVLLEELNLDDVLLKTDSLHGQLALAWGNYYFFTRKPDSAQMYYRRAAKLGLKSRDFKTLADAYHNIAEVLGNENQLDEAMAYDSLAIEYAQKVGHLPTENMAVVSIARKLRYKGDYQTSNQILFDNFQNIPEKNTLLRGTVLGTIASNYDDLENFELTQKYYLQAHQYFKKGNHLQQAAYNIANLSQSFSDQNNFDLALKYADSIIHFEDEDDTRVFYHLRKTEAYKGLKQWEEALEHIDAALKYDRLLKDDYGYALDLILKGQIFKDQENYALAFKTLAEAKEMFVTQEIDYPNMEEQLQRDYIYTYLQLNAPEVAGSFEAFVSLNKNLSTQAIDKNLAEMEAKYDFQQKEAQLAQQELKIEQQKNQQNLLIGGIAFSLIMVIGGFFWYNNRQKRKSLETENTLLSLEQNLTHNELLQLNQQLDPHEIKNLLASISPQIQEKAPDAYRKMLQLFNVTKASLNRSMTESIAVQIRQAEEYFALIKETMFEPVQLFIRNEIEDDSLEIPRLLLKNLVENAIKHGIKGKPEGGEIHIHLYEEKDMLKIAITDSGKGLPQAVTPDSGIGTGTYIKLFQILNKVNPNPAQMHIKKQEHGTQVEVQIPVGYGYGGS